jgi:ABC-type tungstate transport system substrate-binding protein
MLLAMSNGIVALYVVVAASFYSIILMFAANWAGYKKMDALRWLLKGLAWFPLVIFGAVCYFSLSGDRGLAIGWLLTKDWLTSIVIGAVLPVILIAAIVVGFGRYFFMIHGMRDWRGALGMKPNQGTPSRPRRRARR